MTYMNEKKWIRKNIYFDVFRFFVSNFVITSPDASLWVFVILFLKCSKYNTIIFIQLLGA